MRSPLERHFHLRLGAAVGVPHVGERLELAHREPAPESAHDSASLLPCAAETSTRTSRPSRPIRLPNSDWPARSSASAPCARSGTAARSWSANGARRAAAGHRDDQLCRARRPGIGAGEDLLVGGERRSGCTRWSRRAAVPPPRCGASGGSVSSIAVPSGSLSAATTMPSSTCGRISRGSCRPTTTVSTSVIATTWRTRSRMRRATTPSRARTPSATW